MKIKDVPKIGRQITSSNVRVGQVSKLINTRDRIRHRYGSLALCPYSVLVFILFKYITCYIRI